MIGALLPLTHKIFKKIQASFYFHDKKFRYLNQQIFSKFLFRKIRFIQRFKANHNNHAILSGKMR